MPALQPYSPVWHVDTGGEEYVREHSVVSVCESTCLSGKTQVLPIFAEKIVVTLILQTTEGEKQELRLFGSQFGNLAC